MALELYAGTLTEHFGAILRLGDPDAAWSDDQVRSRIELWRNQISTGLMAQGHLQSPLDWNEQGPAQRLAIPLDALRALKLQSLYAEQSAAAPPEFLPADAEMDPLWLRASDADFADNHYTQILAPAFWLPGGFDFTFRCPYPDGHEVEAGSTGCLRTELERLGANSFHAGTSVDPRWLAAPATGASLYELARQGWAILWQASGYACERAVPLLMHA